MKIQMNPNIVLGRVKSRISEVDEIIANYSFRYAMDKDRYVIMKVELEVFARMCDYVIAFSSSTERSTGSPVETITVNHTEFVLISSKIKYR